MSGVMTRRLSQIYNRIIYKRIIYRARPSVSTRGGNPPLKGQSIVMVGSESPGEILEVSLHQAFHLGSKAIIREFFHQRINSPPVAFQNITRHHTGDRLIP